MHRTFMASVAVVASLTVVGCNGPAVESGRADVESTDKKAAEKQAAEQRERSEEAAELERRAANLESQWTEMQTKVKTRERTATTGLREEVEEDVKNAGPPSRICRRRPSRTGRTGRRAVELSVATYRLTFSG